MNELREILYRLRKGESQREIARALHLSRNTIRKYRTLAEVKGLLDPAQSLPDGQELVALAGPPPRPRHMHSTLEPLAGVVAQLHQADVEGVTIWRRLREDHGFTGSYSSVRRFLQRLAPKEPEAFCRIETPPGQEAQVDFGYAGLQWDPLAGRQRKTWMFVMTLSWSRHQFVEFVFDQKIPTWLTCHEHAFQFFGGVVERVVLDNLKAAVLKADLQDPVLGEPYRRLAQHFGFLICPNRPRTPRHKGKVESGVHYVQRSFLAGQTFGDIHALNRRVLQWILQEAGMRLHGTTKQAPLARFQQVEMDALQPLPADPFDLIATYHPKVQRDCHVVVEGRYYSAPSRLVGQQVEVYVGRRIVEIYQATELVTTHPVAQHPGERQTRLEHYPEGKRAYLENPPERCLQRAAQIGNACSQVVQQLLSDRVQDRLPAVHALLRLANQYGRDRLEQACLRALHFDDHSYRRIKGILKAGLEDLPLDSWPNHTLNNDSYRFARSGAEFFTPEVAPC